MITDWTDVVMKNAHSHMDGISLHYYTVAGWNGSKGSATDFTPEDYYWTMGKCLEIEPVIEKHAAIMDKYDAKKRIGLLVDEWGTWWDVEPEPIPDISISKTPCATPWWPLSRSTYSSVMPTA